MASARLEVRARGLTVGVELQWTAEVPLARAEYGRQKSGSLRKVTWVWIGLTELPGESQRRRATSSWRHQTGA